MKTVVAIHTAQPMIEPTRDLFEKYIPGVRLIHMVDDSLIRDVISAGKVPVAVKERLFRYYRSAIEAGADVIFNTCSSIGEEALEARNFLPVPLVKIDDAMASEAVSLSDRIGVLATLPTTLSPTVALLHRFAGQQNKEITILEGLAEGAFQAMISGDRETHDSLILEAAKKLASRADLFVLAQGSMARMEQQISQVTGKAVLSSPERGVQEVKKVLDE